MSTDNGVGMHRRSKWRELRTFGAHAECAEVEGPDRAQEGRHREQSQSRPGWRAALDFRSAAKDGPARRLSGALGPSCELGLVLARAAFLNTCSSVKHHLHGMV